MNRTLIIALSTIGLLFFAYFVVTYTINFRIDQKLVACKSNVRVGMTTTEVISVCGRPQMSSQKDQSSSYTYYRMLGPQERFKVHFLDNKVTRIELLKD
jgi:hypothetical protein